MLQKIASNYLEKVSYGGDIVGKHQSYYDYAPFLSVTEQDLDFLEDPDFYKDTVSSMRDMAKVILGKGIATDINGNKITKTILSKSPYNKSSNMDSKHWANQALAALKAKDRNKIEDLAQYAYIWYGTDKAKDIPSKIVGEAKKEQIKQTLLSRIFN
jgi:hypothetical protein